MADTTKTVKLKSSDGVEIVVSESVAMQSQTIRHIIEGLEADGAVNTIPLTNVTAKTLEKVIEYCKKHAEGEHSTEVLPEEDLKKWDQEFLDVDPATLYHLLMAAYNLDISALTNAICKKVRDMTKGKTVEEIRQIFNIKNDFTPEEEEEIARESSWAFY